MDFKTEAIQKIIDYKLGKIDKDVVKISDTERSVDPLMIDRPQRDE